LPHLHVFLGDSRMLVNWLKKRLSVKRDQGNRRLARKAARPIRFRPRFEQLEDRIVPSAPANDNFANATVIIGSSATLTGTNVGATKESGEPNHANNTGGHSVWWSWTASASGQTTIDTIGSNFDTTLGVYTGSVVSSLTTIAGDDDSGGNQTSRVVFN